MIMSSTDPQTQPTPRRSRWRSRRPAALGVALLLALAALAFPASTATAVSIDTHCLGSFARTFSPPVTNTPQTVTVTGTYDYTTCVVGPTATGTETVTLTLSCVTVTAGPATTETLTWHDATGGTSRGVGKDAAICRKSEAFPQLSRLRGDLRQQPEPASSATVGTFLTSHNATNGGPSQLPYQHLDRAGATRKRWASGRSS